MKRLLVLAVCLMWLPGYGVGQVTQSAPSQSYLDGRHPCILAKC